MSEVVIRAENLGKKYLIGHRTEGERYAALRDVVARAVRSFAGSAADMLRGRPLVGGDEVEEFWALKNVSFEVKQGEVIGIIGRNGAGKSTLLKILSRITEPSAGRVSIKGRVASLLEVGTGFHPELTGRENIYLNGAILGMNRAEIRRKFDEIVAFAEIDKFLDTPVKRYSSGMYVRLAFAVAAHLEGEILVVDEVLAVGDAGFQRKCLGKMGEVAKGGRTVLLVSHNMGAVEALCNKAIYLAKGELSEFGDTHKIFARYLTDAAHLRSSIRRRSQYGYVSVIVRTGDKGTDVVKAGGPAIFEINIEVDNPVNNAAIGLGVTTLLGNRILTFHTHYQLSERFDIDKICRCLVRWDNVFLVPGEYSLVAALYQGNSLVDHWEDIGTFTVIASDYFGTGKLPDGNHQGHTLARATWEVIQPAIGR